MNVPANTTLRAFWLMLMNPPAPASFGPKRLTLTLPSSVRLGHAEEREVEPAAVVEVELLVLVDDRLGVHRRAEVEPRGRHAADHARLGGERDELVDALLGRDRGDTLGHADAEVDDAAGPQLHGAAPGDDLALVERHRLDALQRHADFGAVGRVVGGRVGLPMMLGSDTTTQSTSDPGTSTWRGWSDPARAIRSTCTITTPPEFLTAIAIARLSRSSASRSAVTLPFGSAVVPRRKATLSGKPR